MLKRSNGKGEMLKIEIFLDFLISLRIFAI